MSPVRQNWLSTASVYFPKNNNLSLTSFKATKKQQEEIRKMGEGLKPTQEFNQEEANSANMCGCRLSVFS